MGAGEEQASKTAERPRLALLGDRRGALRGKLRKSAAYSQTYRRSRYGTPAAYGSLPLYPRPDRRGRSCGVRPPPHLGPACQAGVPSFTRESGSPVGLQPSQSTAG